MSPKPFTYSLLQKEYTVFDVFTPSSLLDPSDGNGEVVEMPENYHDSLSGERRYYYTLGTLLQLY